MGLPQSGKTTLFEILSGLSPAVGRSEQRLGTVRLADPRLDRLTQLVRPKKSTAATLEVVDPAASFPAIGPRPRGGDPDPQAPLRTADALVLVVRAFANEAIPHPLGEVDPERDLTRAGEELRLADLVQIDSRLERMSKLEKVGRGAENAAEKTALLRLRSGLEAGRALRTMRWTGEEERALRGFSFLSRLPLIVVVNVGETGPVTLANLPEGATQVSLPARAESEVARLPAAERPAFRELFQIGESGLETLLRAAQSALDLLSFFTAGPPEVRAWHLRRGSTALDAAAKIHTDIGRGFVRAEVLTVDQLLESGSLAAARDRGWLRTEGRDYVVQDGDVLHILHTS